MIKAIIEIDNQIASGYSPIKFIENYILKNSFLISYNKKRKEAFYYVTSHGLDYGDILIAKVKLKNLKQI
jgi:hypothetical protein